MPTQERAFLHAPAPRVRGARGVSPSASTLLDGTARLFLEAHLRYVGEINELMELLERRVALLDVLRTALSEPGVYVRIGHENDIPAMRSLAMVATGYGVAQRRMGIVSVIGPVRMNYAYAIPAVREVAHELSRFVEETYAES